MQRYFINKDNILNNQVKISGNDFHHIKNVMRMNVGEIVVLNTFDGLVYEALLIESNKNDVVFEIKKELKNTYKPYNLTLGLSMIKKDNFELVLQKATELGVEAILPLITERSIIKIDDFSKKISRYETIIKEASEQSERTVLPIIHDLTSLNAIDLQPYNKLILCYAREKSYKLTELIMEIEPTDKVLALIGPEGGFTQKEIDLLISKGFVSVSLGQTILRAETAAMYIASILKARMEENI